MLTPTLASILWNALVAGLLAMLVGVLANLPWLRRRPGVLHALWIVVLLKFVTPAFIPVPLLPAEPATPVATLPPPLHERVAEPRVELPAVALAPAAATAPRASITAPPVGLPSWPQVFLAVWLCGTALILLRASIHTLRMRRRVEESGERDERLSRLLDLCCRRMDISCVPDARMINFRCSPFLFAAVRPARICIPRAMIAQFTDEQLVSVINHELAHHVRRDPWTNLLAFVVAAVAWWNPLVWWARSRLRAAQELCCDAMVLSGEGASRRAYAEVLFSTIDLFDAAPPPALLTAGWGSVRSLKARFRMIGDANVIPRVAPAWALVALLLGVSLLCVPIRAQTPAAASAPATTKEAAKSRMWKAQLVDGESGKPLPGLRLHADAVVHTTDANGIAEVSIPEGGGAILSLASQGWWSANMNFLGGSLRGVDPRCGRYPRSRSQ